MLSSKQTNIKRFPIENYKIQFQKKTEIQNPETMP